MKKLVNGKVIDIPNMKLFELAAEGLALQNTTVSNTSDGLEGNVNYELVRKYLKQYDVFFKYLPYPLNAIEHDIKYAALGSFIKSISREKVKAWVNNGLNIVIDEVSGMTIKFINNTWSIYYIRDCDIVEDNTNLALYKDAIGYAEYKWILDKMVKKESTVDFYNVFMKDFIEACNSNSVLLKYEMENMLTFSTIPNKQEFRQNKIININTNEEYMLDIYCNGQTEVEGEDKECMKFTPSGVTLETKKKRIKTYAFDAYAKLLDDSTNAKCKLTQTKIIGLHNLFLELCAIKSVAESSQFPNFYGAILDTHLVFTINKRLFIAKSNRLMMEPIEVANGVELYAVENNKVYFTKSKKINDRVTKDTLYSYSIKDNNIRLCKTIFSY